jgi:AcrR family transcriptional regulator
MISQSTSDAKPDGRRLRGDRTRATVLKRAVEVASTNGLASLTFGRLAGDLGLSKSNLTVLFGSREALQLACLDAAAGRFIELVVTPSAEKRTALERLQTLCDKWFAYLERLTFPGGCFLYATAHEYRARPGKIRERVVMYLDLWKRTLGAAIRAGVESGEFRPEVVPREAVCTLIAYQNAAHLAMLLDDNASLEQTHALTLAHICSLAKGT